MQPVDTEVRIRGKEQNRKSLYLQNFFDHRPLFNGCALSFPRGPLELPMGISGPAVRDALGARNLDELHCWLVRPLPSSTDYVVMAD